MKPTITQMARLLIILVAALSSGSYAQGRVEAEAFTFQSGIQTEATTDVGGGINIGWIDNGDFAEYVIDVPTAGTYKIDFRLASASAGGTLGVIAKGAQVGTLTVSGTGGWQNWTTLSTVVALTAGQQTLRFNFTGNGNGLFNLNWFQFTQINASSSSASSSSFSSAKSSLASSSIIASSASSVSSAVTIHRIEAEHFTAQSGIQTEATTDVGGGTNIGWIDNGDFVEYNITVATAGTYKFYFRVASNTAGGMLSINANNVAVGSVNVNGTGGWQNWTTISTDVALGFGPQKLRLNFAGTGALFNINWIDYSLVTAASSSSRSSSSSTSSVSSAPMDLTEGNASEWGSFADVDNAVTSVTNDTTNVKAGNASLKFTTASGFDTGVKYPKFPTAHLNLTDKNLLRFWLYAKNPNSFGFQGNQPIVEIISATGKIRYTANTALNSLVWRRYNLPLQENDAAWTKSVEGTPNLADVNQIIFHFDTWDSGFEINIDGVEFLNWTGNPPPMGPTPPAGVNPNQVTSKVLLYVYDPIIASSGKRLHEHYGWEDPVTLAQESANDLYESSHHLAKIEFTEIKIVNEYPAFEDGHRFTDAEFAQVVATKNGYPLMFSYKKFIEDNQIVSRVESGDIDEVWIYSIPWGGMWESTMVGDGAYWLNSSPVQNVRSNKLFAIMGLNYERGVAEAIHSFGHRTESIMSVIYSSGSPAPGQVNNWEKFTMLDQNNPGSGGVGNVHFPVNAVQDYEYSSNALVTSNAIDWQYYPNFQGLTGLVSQTSWARPDGNDHRGYLNWWYAHIPHFADKGPDNFLNNWWRYIVDIDQFKSTQGNLKYTTGIPNVVTTTPTEGAIVSGQVVIKANASADGALGRVDLYIDGNYTATDSLAPFTFVWNATGLSGNHIITTKAYELQKGTEAVSQPVQVIVNP